MPNTIILKKSSVAGKVPLSTDLVYGELALNYTDGKLYYKTASNSIEYIANGGTFTNALIITTTTNATSTLTGALQVRGGVGIGGNLQVGGTVIGGGVRTSSTSTAPTNPVVGDLWYNTSQDVLYRFTNDGTSNYWIDINGPASADQTPQYVGQSGPVDFGASSVRQNVIALSSRTLDCNLGNYFTFTSTNSGIWSFINAPQTGSVYSFVLELIAGGSYTQTWPGSTVWDYNTAPTLSTGTDLLIFLTSDGGVTWRGIQAYSI